MSRIPSSIRWLPFVMRRRQPTSMCSSVGKWCRSSSPFLADFLRLRAVDRSSTRKTSAAMMRNSVVRTITLMAKTVAGVLLMLMLSVVLSNVVAMYLSEASWRRMQTSAASKSERVHLRRYCATDSLYK